MNSKKTRNEESEEKEDMVIFIGRKGDDEQTRRGRERKKSCAYCKET
jgi:hypothetical protein